jgi:hypothetical protein
MELDWELNNARGLPTGIVIFTNAQKPRLWLNGVFWSVVRNVE